MLTENQPWTSFFDRMFSIIFSILVIFDQGHAIFAEADGCVIACFAKGNLCERTTLFRRQ